MPDSLYFWDFQDNEAVQRLRKDRSQQLSSRDRDLYWLRLKVGGDPFAAIHSFNHWPGRSGKTHPEYFAVDEEGQTSLRHLNYASEAVVEQAVADIRNFLVGKRTDENGHRLITQNAGSCFGIVLMDGSNWSFDPQTQALLLGGRKDPAPTRFVGDFNNNWASRYIFQFVNRVACRVRQFAPDPDNVGIKQKWFATDADESDWAKVCSDLGMKCWWSQGVPELHRFWLVPAELAGTRRVGYGASSYVLRCSGQVGLCLH